MTKKRMVLEIGMGTDIRGADPTKAACRALRDALWHNSLSIAPALGHPLEAMIVDIHIGVPRPELVDKAQVLAVLPYGKGTVAVVTGAAFTVIIMTGPWVDGDRRHGTCRRSGGDPREPAGRRRRPRPLPRRGEGTWVPPEA